MTLVLSPIISFVSQSVEWRPKPTCNCVVTHRSLGCIWLSIFLLSTNVLVIKQLILYNNIDSATHFVCDSPLCAYRQPPNHKRMLGKSYLSRIPSLVGNSKCMKSLCLDCDMLDTRKQLHISGTSSTIQPGNYNCDSCNIVYLLMCDICFSGNYFGETSNKHPFRLSSHEKSIRDNSTVFLLAVHFNQP